MLYEELRLSGVPTSLRSIYKKGFSGSKANALKAKCLECSCNQREEIRSCTVVRCPLWEVRPYRVKELSDEKSNGI